MSPARHLMLVLLCACGKIGGGDADSGALPDGAGAACMVDAGALALALQSPPACTPDPDGGFFSAACQQWADSLVSGTTSFCDNGHCTFGLGEACTPGTDGDAQCQAWLQRYAKSSYAYGKCWPRGPNDPGAVGNGCVAADQCAVIHGNGMCTCGTGPPCYLGNGVELCLNVGGTPTCTKSLCE